MLDYILSFSLCKCISIMASFDIIDFLPGVTMPISTSVFEVGRPLGRVDVSCKKKEYLTAKTVSKISNEVKHNSCIART